MLVCHIYSLFLTKMKKIVDSVWTAVLLTLSLFREDGNYPFLSFATNSFFFLQDRAPSQADRSVSDICHRYTMFAAQFFC